MFGNNSLATWGTSQWGTILPAPGAVFALNGNVSGDLDKTFALDANVGLEDQDATFDLDATVSRDEDAVFALSAAIALLPPAVYAQITTSPYLLVELLLPAGPIRVATKYRCALGRTFSPRLRKGGQILRTIGVGTDDLRLELDDTTTSGAERFRDLFAADAPEGSLVSVWLGADGAADGEHQLVFEGKIEHVQGFSKTVARIQVVRREQVEDVILGQLIDAVAFPDAPPETISRMLPVVFGTLDSHAGVVVNTNVLGSLLVNVFTADVVVQLVDASEFPAAGQVRVGGELIDYTTKVGDDLGGLTRGAAGTIATDHPKGSEVAEVGAFQVKFASHSLGFLRRFKLRLPNGNLGDPVPQPTTVDPLTALATWDEGLPQIRDPDARPTYQRIHFKEPDAANTALNAQFASRESTGYEWSKVAQVPGGSTLALTTHVEGVGQPGDISRAWIGSIHDVLSVLGIIAHVNAGSSSFILNAFDTVPDSIARNDEKTGDRIYDVPPPVVDVSAPALIDFSATPQNVVDPGLFVTVSRASNAVDKNDDTFACYQFVGIGEAIVAGGGDVICRWTQQEWESAFPIGSTPAFIEIRALMGTTLIPLSSPWEVYITLDGVEVVGTRLKCQTANPAGGFAGFIAGVEEFKLPITGAIDTSIVDAWEHYEFVMHPVTGVSTGLWCAHEVSLQGQNTPPLPVIDVLQDTRRSVTNYFEVTDQLLLVDGEKSWDSFTDPAALGRVTFTTVGGEPLIIETFWVVEFTPFVKVSHRVPDVFADVTGLVPSGSPTEIARTLIQRPAPEGLGLGPDRIDQSAYIAAASSLAADQVRADFALSTRVSAVGLLSELAGQVDCRDTWNNKLHRLVRLPRADTLIPVDHDLSKGDYLRLGAGVSAKSFGRTSTREVANRVTATWRHYAPSGDTSKTVELNDAASQASNLGLREGVLELQLLQDDASANLVATRKLERLRTPRWTVSLDIPIYALNFKAGDLVSSTDPEFSFQVGEITQVNLKADRLKRVGLLIVVWLK
jgi:hypothetical protein